MNRVFSRRYPGTVCEVVYEKKWDRLRKRYVGAFSWTEFDIIRTRKASSGIRRGKSLKPSTWDGSRRS